MIINPRYRQESVHDQQTDVTLYNENRNRSVFVRDLPYFCTSTDLKNLFEEHMGPCVEETIVCFNRHGQSLHYGYVMFYYEEDAQKSVDIMNGIRHDGRDLRVQAFTKEAPAESSKEGKIYVSFIAQSELVPRVSESTMRAAFEQTFPGHFIDHISIRSHKPSDQGLASGFGFISFDNEDINNQVVQTIRQIVINDVKYDCNFSRKHQQLMQQMQMQQQQPPAQHPNHGYDYGYENNYAYENGYENGYDSGYYPPPSQQQHSNNNYRGGGYGPPPRYDSNRYPPRHHHQQQQFYAEQGPNTAPSSHYGHGPAPSPYAQQPPPDAGYDYMQSGRSLRSAARDLMRGNVSEQFDDYHRSYSQQQPQPQPRQNPPPPPPPPPANYAPSQNGGGGYGAAQQSYNNQPHSYHHQPQQQAPSGYYQQQQQGYGPPPPLSPPVQYHQYRSPPTQYNYIASPPQFPAPPLALQMPFAPMSPPLVHSQIQPQMSPVILATSPSPGTAYLPFGGVSPFVFDRSPAQTSSRPQYLSNMNYLQQGLSMHQPIRNRPSWQYFQELSMSQQQKNDRFTGPPPPQLTPPQNYRLMPNAIPSTYQQQNGSSLVGNSNAGGYRNVNIQNSQQQQQLTSVTSQRSAAPISSAPQQQPTHQLYPSEEELCDQDILPRRPRTLSGETAQSGSHRSVHSLDAAIQANLS